MRESSDNDKNAIHQLKGLRKKPVYVVTYGTADELDLYYEAHPITFIGRRCDALSAVQIDASKDADHARDHALDVRALYLGALESLLATWAAHAEAPRFPPAWLLLYELGDLRAFVTAMVEEARAFVVGVQEPWRTRVAQLFPLLMQRSDSDAEAAALATCFIAWGGDFQADGAMEWNGMKHGFRVRSGRFVVGFKQDSAPIDEPMSYLHAAAGTHVPYLKPLGIGGFEKRAFLFAVKSVAVEPERDLNRLALLCRATRNLLAQAHVMHRKNGSCEYESVAIPDLWDVVHASKGSLTGCEFTPVVPLEQVKEIILQWEKESDAGSGSQGS